MIQRSLKNNFLLNLTRVFFTTFIGLFTLPYLNKTLGVSNIGQFDYSVVIVNYFIMFSALGMPMYAIREISKYKDKPAERTKVLLELLIIVFLTSLLASLLFFIFFLFNKEGNNIYYIYYILFPTIIFTNISIDWFYQAIEDQYYITIRLIFVKLISIIALFLFVNTKDDLLVYTFIYSVTIIINTLINILNLKRYINIDTLILKKLKFKKHVKGIFMIFLGTISISIYTQLSITILGHYGSEYNVGIYTTANKLNRFALIFATTLGAVMLPRLSNLYHDGNIVKYKSYIKKAFDYLLLFSFIIFTLLFTNANYIINIMAGKEFESSILLMRILSFQIVFISLSYCMAFMILYPEGKEKIYTYIVTFASIVSVVLSIIIVPKYLHLGTTIISLISEIIGFLLMLIFLFKKLKSYKIFNKNIILYAFNSIISISISFIFFQEIFNNYLGFIVNSFSTILIFIIILIIFKNDIIMSFINKIKFKLCKFQ